MYNREEKEKKQKSNNVSGRQYLTFKIANENYGLELTQAKEIIKPPRVTNVPNTEESIQGVINLRGQVIPVIDMEKKLGLNGDKTESKGDKRIIVINIKNMLIRLYVDNVREVVKLGDDEIEDVSETKKGIKQEYIKGVSTTRDVLIIILNLDNLLFSSRQKKGA
jgi:purine-binding chemotaxis protein CheW